MNPTNHSASGSRYQEPASPWSLSIGQVAGIPIRLHLTFLLLLAWIGLSSLDSPPGARLGSLLFIVGLFACVLLHELGHSLAARKFGIPVAEIVLYPIGGVARIGKMPRPREEFWITVAGPAVNLAIAAVLWLSLSARQLLPGLSDAGAAGPDLWQRLLVANIALFVFNMLPAFPMDGGRILRSLLAMRVGETRATVVAAGIGQALAVGIGLFALLSGNIMLILVAAFVFLGAGQEAAFYRSKALVDGHTVGSAMLTDFRALPLDARLQDATEVLLRTSQQDFPVMANASVHGLLTRDRLLHGLAAEGPEGYVAGHMDREFVWVAPHDPLEGIAVDMQAGATNCVLVLEHSRLVGMVTRENLAEFAVIRQMTRHFAPARGGSDSLA